jgi:pimeloyl-ACP methyl ester carboxylesterase
MKCPTRAALLAAVTIALNATGTAALGGIGTAAAADAAPAWLQCTPADVPVSGGPAGAPSWTIYGELCWARGTRPQTVQLLVHGATYAHTYWDVPYRPAIHSYVRAAAAAGYATFSIDHIGTGRSTRPPSADVHLNTVVDTLSEVIAALRAGAIGGIPFRRVVWVGHSYGSALAWAEASRHHDVDAFVLTGMLHGIKLSTFSTLGFLPAAVDDPARWGTLDPGYLTIPDSARRAAFFYPPTTDPAMLGLDPQLKDTATATELAEVTPLMTTMDPATAPSRQIHVPTLLVLGDHDGAFCGAPDGVDCTLANVRVLEAPYYAPDARLHVVLVPQTGHSLTQHETAPLSAAATLAWTAAVAPPTH